MSDEEDFTPRISLEGLSDGKLQFYHKVLHFYFRINQAHVKKPVGWSQKDIFVVHSKIVGLFKERGLVHMSADLLDNITCSDKKSSEPIKKNNEVFVSEEELTNAIFEKEREQVRTL